MSRAAASAVACCVSCDALLGPAARSGFQSEAASWRSRRPATALARIGRGLIGERGRAIVFCRIQLRAGLVGQLASGGPAAAEPIRSSRETCA